MWLCELRSFKRLRENAFKRFRQFQGFAGPCMMATLWRGSVRTDTEMRNESPEHFSFCRD